MFLLKKLLDREQSMHCCHELDVGNMTSHYNESLTEMIFKNKKDIRTTGPLKPVFFFFVFVLCFAIR